MIDRNTPGRKKLIAKISALTDELERLDDDFDTENEIDPHDPMDAFERPSDKLDTLVHDCASEMATEVNNNGQEGQLEFLLRNGWTSEDILGRLKTAAEEVKEDS